MDNTQHDNPMGTDGFEFVEYCSPDPIGLANHLTTLGFVPIAKHRSKEVTLYRQGQINFILNADPNSFASQFADKHGPSACAMAFRVKDADKAYQRALEMGGKVFDTPIGPGELTIPAIYGIGDSALYFVDTYGSNTIYDTDFEFFEGYNSQSEPKGAGLTYIDHLTHNVYQGNMDTWANY